ncbi:hypothetical protein ACQ4M4_20505 [Leptolyngbya sp. AN02str]|uniref:hypothetical protein n=1 Tax=Leptolyngbya sp. AN02str TaxID=3423363 RepID=UPI003D314888
MGYSIQHSGSELSTHDVSKHEVLKTEKRALQRRIFEIEEELYELSHSAEPTRRTRAIATVHAVEPTPRSKFEETCESIFAVFLSFGAIGALALLIL